MSDTTPRVYTPHEHSLIEKYRDCNVDYDGWDEFTIEHFVETARAFGYDTDVKWIQCSGFFSQGDGASFTFPPVSFSTLIEHGDAAMRSGDYDHVLDPANSRGFGAAFHALYLHLDGLIGVEMRLCKEGRQIADGLSLHARRQTTQYCHARTVMADIEVDADEELFRVLPEVNKRIFTQTNDYWSIEDTRKAIDKLVEDIADALYCALEQEYEYQTSDDQVWESIEANEWHLLPENQPENDDEEIREAA